MPAIEITKSDWKLFRERLPGWQEKYMERLVEEYAKYLQSDLPASTKFWEMEKRIKEDKRRPGVQLSLEKKNVDFDLMRCFLQVQFPESCRQKWRKMHLHFGENCRLPVRLFRQHCRHIIKLALIAAFAPGDQRCSCKSY